MSFTPPDKNAPSISPMMVDSHTLHHFPLFDKGTTPTLLDSLEAKRVKEFIENFLFNFRGTIRTGKVNRKFSWKFSHFGNELELWIPTDLITDPNPTLGNDLEVDRYKIIARDKNLILEATQGGAVEISGGSSSILDQAQLWMRGTGGGYVGLTAPSDAGNTLWELPPFDGTAGQVLKTTGGSPAPLEWTDNGAPLALASYVVMGGSSALDYERVLTAGTGITITDGGANSTVTIAATGGGGGGMTSFDAAGDSGAAQTITNGNTLTIAGGTALASVASATDTITLNHDNSGASAATYGSATQVGQFTVNAQGHITSATNVTISGGGGGGMTSWDLSADTGSNLNVTNAVTILLTGGTFIKTANSSTTCTVSLSATGTPSSGKFLRGDNTWADLTAMAPSDSSFVVMSATGDLSAERVLTAGTGITITDGGANSTVTIAATGGGGGSGTLDFTGTESRSGEVEIGVDTMFFQTSVEQSTSEEDDEKFLTFYVSAIDATELTCQIGRRISTQTRTDVVGGSTGSSEGDSEIDVGLDVEGVTTFRAGDQLIVTGDGLSGTVDFSLATSGAVAGTYGSDSEIPIITVNDWGQITDVYAESKLAIVKSSDPDPDAYVEMYCTESPEVLFEDVVTVWPEGKSRVTQPIDPEFVHVCEPGMIKAVGHTTSEPAIAGIKIVEGSIEVEFADLLPIPKEVVIHLMAPRAGHLGRRFTKSTKAKADHNSRFWRQAHSGTERSAQG